MISDYEFEDVQNKLTKLRQEFDELSIKYQEHAPNRSLNPAYPHGQPMFAFREIHGPLRQDIDNAHTVTFFVDYDTFISKLYNAKLKVRFHNVRANVTSAAGGGGGTTASTGGGGTTQSTTAGGAQTSSAGGAQTSSAGGGQTTSSAPAASPTSNTSGTIIIMMPYPNGYQSGPPSTPATQDVSQSHQHAVWGTGGALSDAQNQGHTHSLNNHTHTMPDYPSTVSVSSANHQHVVVIAGHDHTVTNHDHTVTNHQHTVADHQHSITLAGHTHDVVMGNHSHGLTYGIFEQAYSNPGLSISINGVDRTAALGGPWNASPGTLDITQYLRETSDDPVRGEIPIVFSVASSLLNIEATLKSMVFSSDLLAAGGV